MIKFFKKKYIHESTGDVLNFSEQISWKIQGIIRNWLFVIAWTATTIVWWLYPHLFGDNGSYVKWMNLASWLAVTVELIIGIAMIGQTKRDAMIIRHILKLEKQEIEHLQDLLEDDDKL
jgi:magnesium-transporting ATPase (P-type)